MKKVLITGSLGQDGSYLIEHLLEKKEYEIYALIRRHELSANWVAVMTKAKAAENKLTFLYGDVRDELSLQSAIQKAWPDELYNFAGQVFVPVSWNNPDETFNVNTGGLARILKIVERVKADCRVYQASTSEMFGNHAGKCTDKTEFNPTSPYGVSKLAAHKLAGIYRDRGLYVVCGILFNHESPRRGSEMVTMKIARQVAAWALGDTSKMTLGNVESRRDWGYAAEYVRAMHLMMQQSTPGDYVVGTGESHSVKEFFEVACEAATVDKSVAWSRVITDSRLSRQQEIHDMHADNSKIKALGWAPETSFRKLVAKMVSSEISRIYDSLLTAETEV